MSNLEPNNARAMTELLIPAAVLYYSTAQENANHVAPDLNLEGAVHESALIKLGEVVSLHGREPSAVHLVNSAEFLGRRSNNRRCASAGSESIPFINSWPRLNFRKKANEVDTFCHPQAAILISNE